MKADEVFSLQVSLARVIYSIESKILELKTESKNLEKELRRGKTDEHVRGLKMLIGKIGALERMIDYGKMVGEHSKVQD